MFFAGLASAAAGQGPSYTSDSSVAFTLHWSEQNGNNNGVLEPGERAILSLDVSFTHQFQTATLSPPIGSFSAGTILGLASGFIDIDGTGGTQGAWNVSPAAGFGVDPAWYLAGNGTPSPDGTSIWNLQFGQFRSDPATVNPANPLLSVWRGLWTPSSFAPRAVRFDPTETAVQSASAGAVLIGLSETELGVAFVLRNHYTFTGVVIPVVPAPLTAAPLLIGASLVTRRRRS